MPGENAIEGAPTERRVASRYEGLKSKAHILLKKSADIYSLLSEVWQECCIEAFLQKFDVRARFLRQQEPSDIRDQRRTQSLVEGRGSRLCPRPAILSWQLNLLLWLFSLTFLQNLSKNTPFEWISGET
ncbi:hypothetical protein Emag_001736 [Eimeria magna]